MTGFDLNSVAKSVGLFALGALAYLFIAPRLLSNPPFVTDGSFNFPGLTPAAAAAPGIPMDVAAPPPMEEADPGAEVTSFATFADDVVPGVMPQGLRMSGGV